MISGFESICDFNISLYFQILFHRKIIICISTVSFPSPERKEREVSLFNRDEKGGCTQNTTLSFENWPNIPLSSDRSYTPPPQDFSPKVRQKGPKFLQNGAEGAFCS